MGTTLGAILGILGLILGVLGGAQSALDYKGDDSRGYFKAILKAIFKGFLKHF